MNKPVKVIMIALSLLTSGYMHAFDSFFTINNHSNQAVKIDLVYMINNASKAQTINLAGGAVFNWKSPLRACLVSYSLNDIPRPIFTTQNAPNYPACMEQAVIDIWPAGNTTVNIIKLTRIEAEAVMR